MKERCSSRSDSSEIPQIGITSSSRRDGMGELCTVLGFCSSYETVFFLQESYSSRSGSSEIPQIGITSSSRRDGMGELCSVSIICSCCETVFLFAREVQLKVRHQSVSTDRNSVGVARRW